MDPVYRDWYIQKNTAQVGEYGVKQAPFDVNMPTDRKCRQVHSFLIMAFLSQNNVWTSGFVVSILFFVRLMFAKHYC